MNILPKEIEDIIIDNVEGINHKQRFQPTLDAIKAIDYSIHKSHNGMVISTRELASESYMEENSIEYYNITTQDLVIEYHSWFRSDECIHTKMIHDNLEGVYFEDLGMSFD